MDGSITLFPNPAKDELNILLPESDAYVQIRIRDISGKLIYQTEVNNTHSLQINTSGWSKGIYFVYCISNSSVRVEKLVRE
jgi:hypothetical protein